MYGDKFGGVRKLPGKCAVVLGGMGRREGWVEAPVCIIFPC